VFNEEGSIQIDLTSRSNPAYDRTSCAIQAFHGADALSVFRIQLIFIGNIYFFVKFSSWTDTNLRAHGSG
jgi:hypothetical protein